MADTTELVLYVVFDHPDDFPNNFVCRQQTIRWDRTAGSDEMRAQIQGQPEIVMGDFWLAPTLEMVRALIPEGKYRMDRMPGDDPKIIEVWI